MHHGECEFYPTLAAVVPGSISSMQSDHSLIGPQRCLVILGAFCKGRGALKYIVFTLNIGPASGRIYCVVLNSPIANHANSL